MIKKETMVKLGGKRKEQNKKTEKEKQKESTKGWENP